MEKTNPETISQKAAAVLAAVDRDIWKTQYSTVPGSSKVCPTPESYIERFGIKEEDYANLFDIIGSLKENPILEVYELSDFAPCTLSYRGEEWIWTYDGERDVLTDFEEAKHILPMLLSNIHNAGRLGTREIEYCEDCGKELQIDPYHECEED